MSSSELSRRTSPRPRALRPRRPRGSAWTAPPACRTRMPRAPSPRAARRRGRAWRRPRPRAWTRRRRPAREGAAEAAGAECNHHEGARRARGRAARAPRRRPGRGREIARPARGISAESRCARGADRGGNSRASNSNSARARRAPRARQRGRQGVACMPRGRGAPGAARTSLKEASLRGMESSAPRQAGARARSSEEATAVIMLVVADAGRAGRRERRGRRKRLGTGGELLPWRGRLDASTVLAAREVLPAGVCRWAGARAGASRRRYCRRIRGCAGARRWRAGGLDRRCSRLELLAARRNAAAGPQGCRGMCGGTHARSSEQLGGRSSGPHQANRIVTLLLTPAGGSRMRPSCFPCTAARRCSRCLTNRSSRSWHPWGTAITCRQLTRPTMWHLAAPPRRNGGAGLKQASSRRYCTTPTVCGSAQLHATVQTKYEQRAARRGERC
jgi:hypothetical protein